MNATSEVQKNHRSANLLENPALARLAEHNPELRYFIDMWQFVSWSGKFGWWEWSAEAGYTMYFNPWQQDVSSAITQVEILSFEVLPGGDEHAHRLDGDRQPEAAQDHNRFVIQAEIQFDFANGQRRWYFLMTHVVLAADPGESERVTGLVQDITSRREVESSLQVHQERYEYALRAVETAVWELDHGDWSLTIGDTFYQLLGRERPPEGTTIQNMLQILHPDHQGFQTADLSYLQRGVQENFLVELRARAINGEYRWMLVNGRVIEWMDSNEPKRTIGIVSDITERKAIENELRQSEERYRNIVQQQSEMICRYLPDGTITFVNEAYSRFFQQSPAELIGSKFWQFVHRDDVEAVRAELESAAVIQQLYHSLHREVLPGGEVHWVEWTDQPAKIVRGVVQEYLSTGRDVTDRVVAERALRESEQRLRLVAEKASDMIAILRPSDLRIQFISPACRDILMLSPEQLVGKSAYDWVHAEDLNDLQTEIRRQMRKDVSLHVEFRAVRGDGKTIWIETTGKLVVQPETGKFSEVITISREITDRKQAEQHARNEAVVGEQLRKIDQAILSASSGEEFFQPAVDILCAFLPCQRLALLTYDPIRKNFLVVAQKRIPGRDEENKEIAIQTGESLESLHAGGLLGAEDTDLPTGIADFVQAVAGGAGCRVILAPILAQQTLMGILILAEAPDQRLETLHLDFLRQVTKSLAYGLRQAALLLELRRHIHLQEALREVSLELLEELDLATLLRSIVNHSYEFAGANAGRIYIETADPEWLFCAAAVGNAAEIVDPDIHRSAGLTGKALALGYPVYQENYQQWEGRLKEFDDRDIDGVVAVPIIHGRDRFGAIVLSIPKDVPFTQQKEAFLNLFAVQAAIAIRNARAYEEEKHAGQQLRDLHQYLERAREAERARISREIHDELGQRLTALKMDTAWVARRVGDPPRGVQQKLQDMLALIDETIQDVRRVATDLRPGLLDDLGLAAAIEWKLNDFSTRNQIPCSSQLDDVAVDIDETTAIAIYRIFQETLTNIARHAQASQVEVQLRNLGDELHLRVRDDGIGMTSEQIQNDHSLGLLGMRERAYTIGADFQITSVPKKGTQMFLRIPVKFTGEGETIND